MARQGAVPEPVTTAGNAEQLTALGSFVASLSPTSLHLNLQRTLRFLRDMTGADAAEIFLAEPDRDGMVLTIHDGQCRSAFFEITRFASGEGFPGLVLSSGRPVMAPDIARDERYLRKTVTEKGFRTCISVPVQGPGGIVSAVLAYFRDFKADIDATQDVLALVSTPIGMMVAAGLSQLREAGLSAGADNRSQGGAALRRTSERVLDWLITIAEADGGGMTLLDYDVGSPGVRVGKGVAPKSVCPLLRRSAYENCPAVYGRRSVVSSRRRTTAEATPCMRGCGREAVRYCVPLIADTKPVAVAELYYRCANGLPPTRGLVAVETFTSSAGKVIREALQPLVAGAGNLAVAQDNRPTAVVPSTLDSEAVAAPHLAIRCFGSLEIYRKGAPVGSHAVKRRRTLSLLGILLAYQGRPVSKHTLIELLWPEAVPETRVTQLYVLVHELRQLLEPGRGEGLGSLICTQGDRYYFRVDGSCLIDVVRFKDLRQQGVRAEAAGDAEGAIHAYETAVELYRGDYMEDEPFAEWCWQEREHLREMCVDMLLRLGGLCGQSENWDKSILYYRRALQVDQFREEAHRGLMFALWVSGRRTEAIEQYQRCDSLLRSELDIGPVPETNHLLQRIRENPRP